MKTKKSIIVALLLCFFLLPVAADNPNNVSSEVIFYRENVYQGSAATYRIFSEDSLIVKLSNNSFYVYECNPGVYDFSVEKNRLAMLRLNVEPNKTYYVRFGINVGFWTAVPELLVVDSISARQRIASGSMKHLDGGTPTVRPKNRIGLDFGVGVGFNNMDMLETTDGRDVKFSFGGGVLVGLQYGREINQHFDLAFGLMYRSSSLSPTLRNAEMTFGRGVFSVTPSYIIPIGDGERSRLKLGVGADYYFGTKLKIDLDEVENGFVDDWKYNNPLGFHVSAIYEISPSDKFSYMMGVKYSNIRYEFERGNFTFPTSEELSRTNGSGIDFVFGLYYHF